jgi:hypothetical protein
MKNKIRRNKVSKYNTDKKIKWGIHSDFQKIYDTLLDKVPAMGKIKGNNNKKLEKFRKATLVIYDIFNNGLMNRSNQLRVLGLKIDDLWLPNEFNNPDWDYNEEVVWNAFKPILIDAIEEQQK